MKRADPKEIVTEEKIEKLNELWGNPEYFESEAYNKKEELKILGLTIDELDSIHEEAYEFFEQEDYEAALDLLQLLTIAEPVYKHYWMDSAKCLVYLEQYEEAFEAIAMANRLDTKDPYPYYYGAACLMGLDENAAAIGMLDQCVDISMEDHDFRPLEEEAKKLRQEIQEGEK